MTTLYAVTDTTESQASADPIRNAPTPEQFNKADYFPPHCYFELTDFPNSMQELAEVIGLNAVIDIVRSRGGLILDVPVKYSDHLVLNEYVDTDTLQKLIKVYEGEEVEIPTCNLAIRRAKLCMAFNTFQNNTEMARAMGMTKRGIRKALSVLEYQGRIVRS